ncbi:hypothetical protein A9179_04820 [Pseudomonas alcaligenes]|uniref:Uncharacterized protein n=1 Tax=Aquipseudomonas alcaligenes TaxID=43263 RepID=A0ABR7RWP3_AQUAC|nr:SMP-30/gluconolaconase/LRE-like region [Pseudomonas alcaligenes]MBC9249593.1 hypothetical protein [Pseudomonas alcaligenes]
MKVNYLLGAVLAASLAGAWLLSTPPAYIELAPAYSMGEVSGELRAVQAPDDLALDTRAPEVPGHDDILLREDLGQAFISARDGWFWRMDLRSGHAERFAQTPLVPSGARFVPGDRDRILFCNSHLYGFNPPAEAAVGIYELNLVTRAIRPVALRVPLPPPVNPAAELGSVQPLGTGAVAVSELNASNSRPIAFCNDLDISQDGQRVYMSEPYAAPGAGMGEAAFEEAVSLANHGRLWLFDLQRGSAQLVAQDLHFIDGILVDRGSEDANGIERSLVISETPKFRLLRLTVAGAQAGHSEVLQEALPGMPDGLQRDAQGRLYVAFYAPRSALITWLHANPWLKPLILRLPRSLFAEQRQSGFAVFDASGRHPLYWWMHDGRAIRGISKVLPERDGIYLASFARSNQGVHRIDYPPPLAD